MRAKGVYEEKVMKHLRKWDWVCEAEANGMDVRLDEQEMFHAMVTFARRAFECAFKLDPNSVQWYGKSMTEIFKENFIENDEA